MAANATTTKRFTAQPWAASKDPKWTTKLERNPGWAVPAMSRTMPVSVPVTVDPWACPCQKPRPGQA